LANRTRARARNRKRKTGGGTGNLLPVAEGQEGITKTAHDLLLLRNPGNQLPGLPTFTKNIFEKAISPMPAHGLAVVAIREIFFQQTPQCL
jgi:hypothetical protein